MLRALRDWSHFRCSLWMIFLGVAAAVACASHPPSHDHEAAHPPLCTDTSILAAIARDKLLPLPDGGALPLSHKSFPLCPLAAYSVQPIDGLVVSPRSLSQSDARTSVSPPMFLVILRQ
jgi:hypothetical protein